mmetsp:Transcript_51541/g.122600  ORF Transcript_51541/g.122600 Transcript_51541/m.122600 type:complete len:276 (-) Transcript_51541:399-1226(-)
MGRVASLSHSSISSGPAICSCCTYQKPINSTIVNSVRQVTSSSIVLHDKGTNHLEAVCFLMKQFANSTQCPFMRTTKVKTTQRMASAHSTSWISILQWVFRKAAANGKYAEKNSTIAMDQWTKTCRGPPVRLFARKAKAMAGVGSLPTATYHAPSAPKNSYLPICPSESRSATSITCCTSRSLTSRLFTRVSSPFSSSESRCSSLFVSNSANKAIRSGGRLMYPCHACSATSSSLRQILPLLSLSATFMSQATSLSVGARRAISRSISSTSVFSR